MPTSGAMSVWNLLRSSTGLEEKPQEVLSQVPLKPTRRTKIEFIQPCLKLMNVQNILTLFARPNLTLQWLSIIGEVFNPNARKSLVTKPANGNKVRLLGGQQHNYRQNLHQHLQLLLLPPPPRQRQHLGSDKTSYPVMDSFKARHLILALMQVKIFSIP